MRQWQHWNIAFTKCLSKMWDQIPVISKAQVFQFFAQVEIAEYRWRWGILNFIPIKFSHISINTWIICCKTDITLTFGYWVDSFQHQVTCLVNVFLLSTVENSNGIFATDCNNISNQFYFINIRLFFRALLIIDVNLNGPKSPLLVLVNQRGFILLKLIPLSPTTATATTI